MRDWVGVCGRSVWAVAQRSPRIRGGMMSITSDVEMGRGLVSADWSARSPAQTRTRRPSNDRVELAPHRTRAENGHVGAATGMMDNGLACGENRARRVIDFRELTVRTVHVQDPEARMLPCY